MIDVSAGRLEYCETWAWCKDVVAAKMRCVRVAVFCSGCDQLAMVLASPRARGCKPALPLGRAEETTVPR